MKVTIQIQDAPKGARVIVDGNNVNDGELGNGGVRTYEGSSIEVRQYGVESGASKAPTDGETSTPDVAATPAHAGTPHVGADGETASPQVTPGKYEAPDGKPRGDGEIG